MKQFKPTAWCSFKLSLSFIALLTMALQSHAESLQIGAWGGTYERAQRTSFFDPFSQQRDIAITTSPYHGGVAALSNAQFDVVDMLESEALIACEQGELLPLSISELFPHNPEIAEDFTAGAWQPCSVAHVTYATLIGYDDNAFNGVKPANVADFFDVQRFPGKRGVFRDPEIILEWALLAEGVPPPQIYDLLSTERGIRLALRRLEHIRNHIVWWDDPAQPIELLRSGSVTMSSGFNGRFFAAQAEGASISMIWDGQVIDHSVWAVPKQSKQPDLAKDFIAFAIGSERLADFAEQIPYGPSRYSALSQVGLHPEQGIPMQHQLPTAPHHMDGALHRDTQWYSRTEKWRKRWFDAWLQGSDFD